MDTLVKTPSTSAAACSWSNIKVKGGADSKNQHLLEKAPS